MLLSSLELGTQSTYRFAGQLCAGARPEPQIYSSLLDSGCQGGKHVACFAELRRNFVNTRPPKLKNLILLVKHWYYQVRPPYPPPSSQEVAAVMATASANQRLPQAAISLPSLLIGHPK